MKWLRGEGIEIGAGDKPTPLYGWASVVLADSDSDLRYGGAICDRYFSLDDRELLGRVGGDAYDFAVASHVLEHLDSFIWGLRNLIGLVRVGGIVYGAVPISKYDYDRNWMQYFPFSHHLEEFDEPLKHAHIHDEAVRLITGMEVRPADRYRNHKHTYEYHDWSTLFVQTLEFLGGSARIVDSSFGYERSDANFVLERIK
jgi:predicted SAM-dependent methyltransferase